MFGKNDVSKSFPKEDGSLLVNSYWYTLQGEGPDSGKPAIFVRLTKCNLRCWFCDTEFESGMWFSHDKLVDQIVEWKNEHPFCNLIVLTGGEPLLQNIIPFVKVANQEGFAVSIETAGSVYLDDLDKYFAEDRSINNNMIVCSPKTPKLNEDIVPLIGAYKYIVRDGELDPSDGLPNYSTQTKGRLNKLYRPMGDFDKPIYLQPCDETLFNDSLRNKQAAVKSCMKHGYTLSLQVHKLCGLD